MKNEPAARRLIIQHEGRRALVYRDQLGHPTVGVGFNCDRNGAAHALANVGADYEAVVHRGVPLTDDQIDALFTADFAAAMQTAATICGAFNGLDEGPQAVLVDMAFQLGSGGLAQFRHFLAALEARDYPSAAYELCNSHLAAQTPARVVDNIMSLLRSLRAIS